MFFGIPIHKGSVHPQTGTEIDSFDKKTFNDDFREHFGCTVPACCARKGPLVGIFLCPHDVYDRGVKERATNVRLDQPNAAKKSLRGSRSGRDTQVLSGHESYSRKTALVHPASTRHCRAPILVSAACSLRYLSGHLLSPLETTSMSLA